MFNKETYEEIKRKTSEINKMKNTGDRINATISFKDVLYQRIADELDELFSNINLKKTREDEE